MSHVAVEAGVGEQAQLLARRAERGEHVREALGVAGELDDVDDVRVGEQVIHVREHVNRIVDERRIGVGVVLLIDVVAIESGVIVVVVESNASGGR